VRTVAAGASPAATSPAPEVDSTQVATDPPATTVAAVTTAAATKMSVAASVSPRSARSHTNTAARRMAEATARRPM
jgi:hypothetical protein